MGGGLRGSVLVPALAHSTRRHDFERSLPY